MLKQLLHLEGALLKSARKAEKVSHAYYHEFRAFEARVKGLAILHRGGAITDAEAAEWLIKAAQDFIDQTIAP